MKSKIVILNGASSTGKTSIARAFQDVMPDYWLFMSMDKFIGMMPRKYLDFDWESDEFGNKPLAKDGFRFVKKQDESGNIEYDLEVGKYGDKICLDMKHAVKTMAELGNNIVLDEVIFGLDGFREYRDILKDFEVYVVCVNCEVCEIERREKARGDRAPGSAKAQVELIDKTSIDLCVDSTSKTPEQLALEIKEYIENNKPQALTGIK